MPPSPKPRVLLLDGQLRHAVAIVRSLGERGVPVIVAGPTARFPARYSRHVAGTVRFDASAPEDGLSRLRALIEAHGVEVLIAAGLPGNELICAHREALAPLVRAPFNDLERFNQLADKLATTALADSLGVLHPRTVAVREPGEARAAAEAIGFPMVFKSPVDQGTVRYPANVAELERLVGQFIRFNPALAERGIRPLAQQYVEGDGHGFYALAEHGEILAYFMHKRLHEVPPSGGASAMARGFRDPVLQELGSRFFAATRWHGVAMVEFKRSTRDGRYYLIEVNPKFWGSLGLSIAAGVDFPDLLYRMLTGDPVGVTPGAYREDTVYRWLTMDMAYAAEAHDWGGFLRRFRDRGVLDDFDRRDPLPTAALFARGWPRWGAGQRAVRCGAGDGGGERARAARVLPRQAAAPAPGTGRGAAGPRPAAVARAGREPAAARRLAARRLRVAGRRARVRARDPRRRAPRRAGADRRADRDRGPARHPQLLELPGVPLPGRRGADRRAARERPRDRRPRHLPRRARVRLGGDLPRAARRGGGRGRALGRRRLPRPVAPVQPRAARDAAVEWDSSMPAWDPFQPKPGDCGRYFPFDLSERCLELPVTLWQDFTLLDELGMRDTEVWRRQADAIHERGGLINVIVHPDYMHDSDRIALYTQLLEHLRGLESIWIATPSEVVAWARRGERPAALSI